MQLYEIKFAELDCFVKFKALLPIDIEEFHLSIGDAPEKDFIQAVLSHFVYNINTDVKDKLKLLTPEAGKKIVQALYHGCVFLNPGLDPETWVSLSYMVLSKSTEISTDVDQHVAKKTAIKKSKPISRAKILSLQDSMQKKVVGQNESIEAVYNSLKRSLTGLGDPHRPLGVFLFGGSSGVGKTHLAKTLHAHLYGSKYPIARVDCGEYQEKHQAMTLLGAPPSYVGYDDEKGGVFAQILSKNAQTVLLLDEVEKAHPSLWNVFLRLFDEGQVTDSRGVTLNFRDTIIIMTTNRGNDQIVQELTGKSPGFGSRLVDIHSTKELPDHNMVVDKVRGSIKKHFKPEFLNRIDDIVVFRHLSLDQYGKIAELEFADTVKKLSSKGISAHFDQSAFDGLVLEGIDTIQGARGMAKVRRNRVENVMADLILDYNLKKGAKFSVSYDTEFRVDVTMSGPIKKRAKNA
jgi:ATP-dependent Clp protease ATP-binding subunit ClpA